VQVQLDRVAHELQHELIAIYERPTEWPDDEAIKDAETHQLYGVQLNPTNYDRVLKEASRKHVPTVGIIGDTTAGKR
jgi:hypothetical protein